MEFAGLEQNICDVIKEGQIKLGYQKEASRLYYPLSSLNRFLQAELSIEEMLDTLEEFCRIESEKLGKIEVSHDGERFCFRFAPEVAEYVHTHTAQQGFLYDFIETISRHGVSMEEVIALFKKYSDKVHVEALNLEEFDYLVYFEDGQPDAYRYCLTDEGCHIIYHRFTEADYRAFCFE